MADQQWSHPASLRPVGPWHTGTLQSEGVGFYVVRWVDADRAKYVRGHPLVEGVDLGSTLKIAGEELQVVSKSGSATSGLDIGVMIAGTHKPLTDFVGSGVTVSVGGET